jgi:ElaB/YqjD/DUF883 family membrane-anchored ribosome-binding protein
MVQPARTRKTLETVENAADSAQETIAAVANDMRENLSQVGASVTRSAQDAIGSVSKRMKDAGVDPDVMADAAKQKVSKLQEAIEDELRERPVRTLAIAAAVGLVVGLLTTR